MAFSSWDHVAHMFPLVDPWMALTAVALNTSRIRLGAMVTPIPRRRPIKLARETTTLDHLSQGRLILGVGIGDMPWEWAYMGEEPNLKVRGKMLDEGLELLTACWQGGLLQHQGDYYRAAADPDAEAPLGFVPGSWQQPRIPIWVGGTWPNKRPFRRAARWDGIYPLKVNYDPLSPEDVYDLVAYIRQHRSSEDPFDIVTGGWSPGDDPAEAEARVAPYAKAGMTWWVESLDPWRFGWENGKDWPIEAICERVQQGPPQVEEI